MNHYESLNHIPTEKVYQNIVEYKQKLETWKIRRYGLNSQELDYIASVYSEVTGNEKPCSTCGGRLFPNVCLQWLYNYESAKTVETTETTKTVETTAETVETTETTKAVETTETATETTKTTETVETKKPKKK